ncbi:MAG: ABC transporter permease [Hydrogenophilales bacterium 16-64-46]|jgi:phospholipid/cholesterol/gamma-HCH transport system permease protein|nr:MAG: ABC transporter permease [Hydrogenophilales bacterium 12-64-13]OYZ05637.1 MAG: ABC transporter permease [Hydrogenophilales bacterium 16-64-46]OZA40216.1 MAG: ABC transporter permease [Hydrogenophilales bacterium 17-64-34]HQT00765.1 ABC transporter permease [Thiobacillus sp.]
MNFLAASIESLGARFVGWFGVGYGLFAFAGRAALLLLDRSTWNRATYDVVIKQVYFTAVQILHVFLGYALVISWLLITIILSTAREFGLTEFATEMTIRVLVLELLPFLTALFIALRSGSAINTEVALMRVNNELDALAHCKVPPMQFEFLPRLIGGVISVVVLAALAGLLALLLAYLSIYGLTMAGFDAFTQTVAKIFDFRIVAGLVIKCALFGLAVTLIPVVSGLETPKKLFMVPVSVLRGMMRVFFAIVAIEVLSLALKYI